MEVVAVDFNEEMLSLVKDHGATNNEFLARFAKGEVSREEVERFAVEFYHFSRHFPVVLCSLLVNTADEEEARELTKILASELGDGEARRGTSFSTETSCGRLGLIRWKSSALPC